MADQGSQRPASAAEWTLAQQLVPLNNLAPPRLAALQAAAEVLAVPPPVAIFGVGTVDSWLWYLLEGAVELKSGERSVSIVAAGTTEALQPLSLSQPHKFSALAISPARLLRVPRDALDQLLAAEMGLAAQDSAGAAAKHRDSHDWIGKVLQIPPFNRMRPEHVHALFGALVPMELAGGEVVVEEGETGNAYYIIQQGRCLVSRQPSPHSDRQQLAILGPGETFGEEALLTGGARNATVAMLSDGRLMRLSRQDFERFVKAPMVHGLGHEQALQLTRTRGAVWLDVRDHVRARAAPVRDSLNLPLANLRIQWKKLARDVPYVVFCDDGSLSTAAAFLLRERGLESYLLEGGLRDAAAPPLAGTAVDPGSPFEIAAAPTAEDETFALALEEEQEAAPVPAPAPRPTSPGGAGTPLRRAPEAAGTAAEVAHLRVRIRELEAENEALRTALSVLAPRVRPATGTVPQRAERSSAIVVGGSAPIPVPGPDTTVELEITLEGIPTPGRVSRSTLAAEARQRAIESDRARETAARAALKDHDKSLLDEIEAYFKDD